MVRHSKCKEGVAAIKAIDKELKRLHEKLCSDDRETNGIIFQRIVCLQDTLNQIARRHNGLEY